MHECFHSLAGYFDGNKRHAELRHWISHVNTLVLLHVYQQPLEWVVKACINFNPNAFHLVVLHKVQSVSTFNKINTYSNEKEQSLLLWKETEHKAIYQTDHMYSADAPVRTALSKILFHGLPSAGSIVHIQGQLIQGDEAMTLCSIY